MNRYKNAVHYDDNLVGDVLTQSLAHDLLKNTIVIITADHGNEFNDTGNGLWGHGSAFDRYQLHVPLIMYWPGKKPQAMAYRTSHYDVVPTLMRALGCTNKLTIYSMGHLLFIDGGRRRLVGGSYHNYVVLLNDRVLVFSLVVIPWSII